MCVGTLKSFRFLVGGGWYTDSSSGLWYWSFREDSGAFGVVGARLLSLIMGLDVYECCFAMSYVLVGGAFDGSIAGGLACWWFALASSITGGMIGARLLIYREMMCMRVPVILPIILSAVLILPILSVLACGIGIVGILRVLLTLTSVLDLLYLKYTLRDLVCWLGLN